MHLHNRHVKDGNNIKDGIQKDNSTTKTDILVPPGAQPIGKKLEERLPGLLKPRVSTNRKQGSHVNLWKMIRRLKYLETFPLPFRLTILVFNSEQKFVGVNSNYKRDKIDFCVICRGKWIIVGVRGITSKWENCSMGPSSYLTLNLFEGSVSNWRV